MAAGNPLQNVPFLLKHVDQIFRGIIHEVKINPNLTRVNVCQANYAIIL